MIALYYHLRVNLAAVRKLFPASTRGMSFLDIRSCAARVGLEAKFFEATVDALIYVNVPFVAHWRKDHFIVVRKITNKKVYVLDPAYGKIRYPRAAFKGGYSGRIAILRPGTATEVHGVERDTLNFVRFASQWVHGHVKDVTVFALLSVVLEVIALTFPYQFQQMMSTHGADVTDLQSVYLVAGGFMVLALVHFALWTLRSRTSSSLSALFGKNLADYAFANAIQLPMNYFRVRHTATVLTKFTSMESLQEALTGSAVELMISGFTSVGYLAFCFLYSTPVGIVSLCFIIAYTLLLINVFDKKQVITHAKISAHTKQNEMLIEFIRCVQAVKLYQKQTTSIDRFNRATYATATADRKFDFLTGFQHGAHGFVNIATAIVILALGGRALIMGTMSVGIVFAMIAYSGVFIMRSTSFLGLAFEMRNLAPYMHWVDDVLQPQGRRSEKIGPNSQPYSADPTIELRSVSFRYEATGDWLLHDVTASLHPVDILVVTGESGCGKSTLLKIMLGILAPDSGSVYVNGAHVSDVITAEDAPRFGAVMQDDQLFQGTIAENITFFQKQEDIDELLLQRASIISGLSAIVAKLPMKYNTLISGNGLNFSGGQRQRVLIARALYFEPSVLFMDEATSQLDIKSELAIIQALRSQGIIQIHVSHRQSILQAATKTLRLNLPTTNATKVLATDCPSK
jgi:ATP-binding cassette subfamily B protein RaxB